MDERSKIKVLIACEESQTVCKAFRDKGIEAYSCDLEDCSGGYPEWHIKGDAIQEAYSGKYTLMIGHPPCRFISYAGTSSWNTSGRVFKRIEALQFFAKLWEAPIPFICLENPKSCASPVIAKYSQEVQPYYFGDPHMKTTWLWLKNLPKLEYDSSVQRPLPIYIDKSGKKRYFTDAITGQKSGSVLRAKTFPGIARAMAEQWIPIIARTSQSPSIESDEKQLLCF